MTARWRNYSGNLQKICDIIGPTTYEKISSQKFLNGVLTTTQFMLIFSKVFGPVMLFSEGYPNNFSMDLSSQILIVVLETF